MGTCKAGQARQLGWDAAVSHLAQWQHSKAFVLLTAEVPNVIYVGGDHPLLSGSPTWYVAILVPHHRGLDTGHQDNRIPSCVVFPWAGDEGRLLLWTTRE